MGCEGWRVCGHMKPIDLDALLFLLPRLLDDLTTGFEGLIEASYQLLVPA
jgi:hypothetical protein